MRARIFINLFLIIIISVAVSSCGKAEQHRYDLSGKVFNVDKRGETVTIAHEEIPGYMEAMTMPFKLKDGWAFDELQAGDSVSATLVVEGERSWIEGIVIVREEAGSAPASVASSIEPNPGDEVPDFTLVNQDAKRIRIKQYRGKPLLLTFIYTRCPLPDYCPLMTANFAEIERAIRKEPALFGEARLLSITVDPEYDTPKVLHEYGLSNGSDTGEKVFERWEYATGTADEIKKIATYFGLQYFQEGDQIIHSLSTALIGPDGRMVKLYRRNEWKPDEVLNDLRNLVTENHQ